ncbi:MAG: hypothetical protein BGO21_05415 [Dyadobacter sp. 50-39]|uniref:sensor histidine kinase n=1 Tax=Dyadobacter sp. 50-39 TaxID=1895756 RepID=UPI000966F2C4|nr:HAMP domain-containing sensor histidine kinase [Dyadobacter sp. 50-39]OJV22594.1 MAG: hypothetical protein BGO21_05415 [Dyadobacter sp. 50-39]
MKLFTRYNRINLSMMVALFLISGVTYYFLINYILIHELDEALEDYRARIESYVRGHGELPPVSVADETRVSYRPTSQAPKVLPPENVTMRDTIENELHKYRQQRYIQKARTGSYLVTLSKPIEGTKMLTRTVVIITVVMLLVVIVASLIVNQLVLRRLWQPFYNALAQVKTFKLGNNRLPAFAQTDIEEFSYMNTLLAETVGSAEAEYQLLKEFTENASHEIQTPLAIIRSKLDLVIQEEGLSDRQAEALKSVYSGIKRLTKLNQSLLLLTKIENRQFSQTSRVDLLEKVSEKLGQFQEFWQNNDISWSQELNPAWIDANPELIEILLTNLISNAGRHNRPGGSIHIRLTANELRVSNSGSDTALDTSRLFRRFYKEVQNSQHNGLGLSIVKQICDQLLIRISYQYSGGLHQFTLSWD